jgi:hypothetical protein
LIDGNNYYLLEIRMGGRGNKANIYVECEKARGVEKNCQTAGNSQKHTKFRKRWREKVLFAKIPIE